MKPLLALPTQTIHTIFTDIDDTLTTHGKLGHAAYQALHALKNAGYRVIPVTGRPAGWCDHIARMWPVDGIVGENGAFYMWYNTTTNRLETRHIFDAATRQQNQERLRQVTQKILQNVPGCAVASDQFCRLYDVAIDFCEDVPALPQSSILQIVRIMEDEGMTAKVSSIHVNGWFGHYDKLSMTKCLMQERYNIDLDVAPEKQHCAFVGDSPNDAPMFSYFPLSVGVANIMQFKENITALPQFITSLPFGEGFAEFTQFVLQHR